MLETIFSESTPAHQEWLVGWLTGWQQFWRQVISPGFVVGVAILGVLIFIAVFAPTVMPYGPFATDPAAQYSSPSATHYLGTDNYGRDVLTRIVYATRLDLPIAIIISLTAFTIGSIIGAFSGYMGGWVDQIVMRSVDVLMAFPAFILAMIITAMMGNKIPNVIFAVSIAYVPYFLRLTRGEVLRARNSLYADAARCVGNPGFRILFLHILPNCLSPAIAQAILCTGWGILDVAGLSFIGIGIQPPTTEWGVLVSDGTLDVISGYWWTSFFPGLTIALAVLSFNLVGDKIKQVLTPEMVL